MFERYTERARRVLFFARYEASELGSLTIETEHVLLGVLRERKGIAMRLLEDADASADDLIAELRRKSASREKISTSVEIPFSQDTKQALVFAADEADRLGHSYIGVEHELLGLLRVERSVAGSVLAAHGIHADSVRQKLVKLLEENPAFAGKVPREGAYGVEPVDGVKSILHFLARLRELVRLREPVADKETLELMDRICRDLEELERRLR